jgi:hypothetical protein
MPQFTRREHFETAEKQLAKVENRDVAVEEVCAAAALALVHATLAGIPCTGQTPDAPR